MVLGSVESEFGMVCRISNLVIVTMHSSILQSQLAHTPAYALGLVLQVDIDNVLANIKRILPSHDPKTVSSCFLSMQLDDLKTRVCVTCQERVQHLRHAITGDLV